ncbi:MAG: NTP transferase domain-containing protein [Alphaproteobacteria bacterium]
MSAAPSRPSGLTLGALVLAAGSSRRFGPEAKLLADLGGQTVLAHALRPYGTWAFAVRVLVTAPGQDAQAAQGAAAGWRIAVNPCAQEGMGTSLAWGVSALLDDPQAPALDGILVGLADMPLVTADVVQGLVGAFSAKRADWDCVAPVHDGRRGHPVLFARACFDGLAACRGDEGARHVIAAAGDRAGLWPCPDPAILMDVDTHEELDALRRHSGPP